MMIHFYKHRFVYFTISIALILVGVIAALTVGIKLDIQFKGGTILKYSYVGDIDTEKAESTVEDALGYMVDAQRQTSLTGSDQMLILNLSENQSVTSQEMEMVTSALKKDFPDANMSLQESLSVEPFVGARFFRNGLFAIGLAFLLILIYVGIRFRNIGGFSAGVMAIVALIHDVLIATTAFIVFQIPLNDNFIAVVLTIIGFSINDTIVIYDRIRENENLYGKKMPVDELVDKSISQSMSRSINTNVAVFVSITIVFIFSQIFQIESIRQFALPMMFGTVSGCYSTICIAGPLWTMWKKHQEKAAQLRRAQS